MLQYYTVHMHAMYSQTQNNTYTKMNLKNVWGRYQKSVFGKVAPCHRAKFRDYRRTFTYI